MNLVAALPVALVYYYCHQHSADGDEYAVGIPPHNMLGLDLECSGEDNEME